MIGCCTEGCSGVSISIMQTVYGIHSNGRIRPSHLLGDLRGNSYDFIVVLTPGCVIVQISSNLGIELSGNQIFFCYFKGGLNSIGGVLRIWTGMSTDGIYILIHLIGRRVACRCFHGVSCTIIVSVEPVSGIYFLTIGEGIRCIAVGDIYRYINACFIISRRKGACLTVLIGIAIDQRTFNLAGSV